MKQLTKVYEILKEWYGYLTPKYKFGIAVFLGFIVGYIIG